MTCVFWLMALAGVGCVLAGLWMIYPPLALIVGGAGLVLAAIGGDKLWGS